MIFASARHGNRTEGKKARVEDAITHAGAVRKIPARWRGSDRAAKALENQALRKRIDGDVIGVKTRDRVTSSARVESPCVRSLLTRARSAVTSRKFARKES